MKLRDWLRRKMKKQSELSMVEKLVDGLGGKIDGVSRLPDGSGWATASWPLPKNHWLYAEGHDEPPMPFKRGTDDQSRKEWEEKIREAGKYAIRASTMNGKDDDFDPDAMLQNLVVGMLGYHTPDGDTHLYDEGG
jgi:hypothetical protein